MATREEEAAEVDLSLCGCTDRPVLWFISHPMPASAHIWITVMHSRVAYTQNGNAALARTFSQGSQAITTAGNL